MKKRLIITNTCIIVASLTVLIVVSLITVSKQNRKFYENETMNYLKIVCEYFDGTNFEETKNYVDSIDQNIRLTIIEKNSGNIVTDNKNENIKENHLDRPELNNLGEVYIRYSTTEKCKMLYVADCISDYYVRVAIPMGNVNKIIYTLLCACLITLVLVVCLSIAILSFLNNKTLVPINREINKLSTLASEDYNDGTIDDLPQVINKITKIIDENINQIKMQEQELESFLGALTQGIVIINNKAKIKYINDKAQKLLEINNKIIGKNYIYLFRDTKLQNKIQEVYENQGIVTYLLQLNARLIQCTITYLTNQKLAGGIIITLDDVTRQANLEKEKRDFFQNASHELKSPLTSIIGYQQLICDGIVDDKNQILEYSEKSLKEAKRMNNIIIDMLNLSSLEQNYQKKFELIKLENMIIEILDSLETRIQAKNIHINLNLSNLEIQGDPKLIDELIRNLIDNAIKYNVENGFIKISIIDNNLIIEDTGIGISSEDQNRIFERFYRVDKGRSKAVGGTGLGLAIVKHICELYNYELSLDSIIRKGTTVTVKLK